VGGDRGGDKRSGNFLLNNFLPALHFGHWQETEKGDGAGRFFGKKILGGGKWTALRIVKFHA
jgi:hypothetical protein